MKITTEMKKKFAKLRQNGYSIKHCSNKLGFSYSSGRMLERERLDGTMTRQLIQLEESPEAQGIKALVHGGLEELKKRGFEDMTNSQIIDLVSKGLTALNRFGKDKENEDDLDKIWAELMAEKIEDDQGD